MRRLILKIASLSFLFISISNANDYDFDLEEIEVKSYEYSAYLKAQSKYQNLNKDSKQFFSKNKNHMDSYFLEANLKYKYFKDDFTLETDFMSKYSKIDGLSDDIYTTNELFLNYKFNENSSFEIGKKSLKWGKGYFFNPVAFLDRKKDPTNPENSREGYTFLNYMYNKSYQGDLKNFSLNLLYLKTLEDFNSDYFTKESNNLALKAYFLYFDTDIDFIYVKSDSLKDKIGFSFSKNLETNFEVHGEFAKEIDGYSSFLLGLKYLTSNDLTITSEYFYQSESLDKNTAFWDKEYLINKFSQKEPFSIVYSSVYFKNMLNLRDKSYQNSFGAIYSFRNGIDLDISYNYNNGNKNSEFGSKLVDSTIWTKLTWYF